LVRFNYAYFWKFENEKNTNWIISKMNGQNWLIYFFIIQKYFHMVIILERKFIRFRPDQTCVCSYSRICIRWTIGPYRIPINDVVQWLLKDFELAIQFELERYAWTGCNQRSALTIGLSLIMRVVIMRLWFPKYTSYGFVGAYRLSILKHLHGGV